MSREILRIVLGVILTLMVGFSISILQGYWTLRRIVDHAVSLVREVDVNSTALTEYLRNEFLVSEVNRAKVQTHLLSYFIKEMKPSSDVLEGAVEEVFRDLPSGYSFILDHSKGYKILFHPMKKYRKVPQFVPKDLADYLERIKPEGVAIYEWYPPGGEEKERKYAYVVFLDDPPWTIGSSIYESEINSRIEKAKKCFLRIFEKMFADSRYLKVEFSEGGPPKGKVLGLKVIGLDCCSKSMILYFTWKDLLRVSLRYFSLILIVLALPIGMMLERGIRYSRLKGVVLEVSGEISEMDAERRIKTLGEYETVSKMIHDGEDIGEILDWIVKSKDWIKGIEIKVGGRDYAFRGAVEGEPRRIDFEGVEVVFYVLGEADEEFLKRVGKMLAYEVARREKLITDQLTGTYTRAYLSYADFKGRPICVLMIDADNFKEVNDTYGHVVGDEILRKIVENIRKGLREGDILVRYGGDEFLVILEGTDYRGAHSVARRIRDLVRENVKVEGVKVTVSIGGVCDPSGKRDLNELIEIADENLYEAKKFKDSVYLKAV